MPWPGSSGLAVLCSRDDVIGSRREMFGGTESAVPFRTQKGRCTARVDGFVVTAYSLGVDLGTTFSAAATVDDTGIPAMVGLGNRAMQIPSVLYVGSDGEVLVGEPAERRAKNDPTRIVREFKRRMGDSVAIYVGGRPFPIEQLTARLLRWVIDQTTERMGGLPERLTLTHPASWTEFNVGKLRQAAQIAGFPDVFMCPEPVAAAFQHARNHTVRVGDRICIYDLGGGTFDVCVVQKSTNGFEILGSPAGLDPLGGIDFDKVVIDRITDELSLLSLDADPEDAGFWRLGRDCVEAKEALSTDVDVTIPVAIGGLTTSLRLTRSEFESLIDDRLDETISMTRHALRSAGLTAADLTAFVLVGGSSRIPLVSEKLTNAFHCPMARNTHPKHDVALGAALAGRTGNASGRAGAASPVADPAGPTDGPLVADPLTGPPVAGAPVGTGRPGRPGRTTLVRPTRSARRWRRPTLISAAVTTVVAAALLGASWVAAPGSMDTARAEGASAGLSAPAPTQRSAETTPAGQRTTGQTSTGQTSARQTSTAVTPLTTDPPATPTAEAPGSLDAASVRWLRVQCDGGNRMRQAMVTDTTFRSLRAAQQAFTASYTLQATIASETATTLSVMEPVTVAGGRIDTAAALAGWQVLHDLLSAAAQTIANLNPTSSTDIDTAIQGIENDRAEKYSPVDPSQLTPAESAFVGTLPGCEALAGG